MRCYPFLLKGYLRHYWMKAAFAQWNNRIAPVFDMTRQIHTVEVSSGKIVEEIDEFLSNDLPVQ